MMDSHKRRLEAFANHLVPLKEESQKQGVQYENCAAFQTSAYARPASSDARFARPALKQFSRDERVYENAVLYGDGAVSGLRNVGSASRPNLPAGDGVAPHTFATVHGWTPQVNVINSKHAYTYLFNLPGVKAGDLKLNLSDRHLKISGKRTLGVTYNEALSQTHNVPVRRAKDPWIALAEVRTRSKPVRQPATVNEGDFEVVWVLPAGNFEAMRAQYANQKLRIILPVGHRA